MGIAPPRQGKGAPDASSSRFLEDRGVAGRSRAGSHAGLASVILALLAL